MLARRSSRSPSDECDTVSRGGLSRSSKSCAGLPSIVHRNERSRLQLREWFHRQLSVSSSHGSTNNSTAARRSVIRTASPLCTIKSSAAASRGQSVDDRKPLHPVAGALRHYGIATLSRQRGERPCSCASPPCSSGSSPWKPGALATRKDREKRGEERPREAWERSVVTILTKTEPSRPLDKIIGEGGERDGIFADVNIPVRLRCAA